MDIPSFSIGECSIIDQCGFPGVQHHARTTQKYRRNIRKSHGIGPGNRRTLVLAGCLILTNRVSPNAASRVTNMAYKCESGMHPLHGLKRLPGGSWQIWSHVLHYPIYTRNATDARRLVTALAAMYPHGVSVDYSEVDTAIEAEGVEEAELIDALGG